MGYALHAEVGRPFDEVLAMVKESLGKSGFGVLTEIDLRKTLKAKIDVDIDEQVILGACNPRFAHKGLQVEPSLGLLLPCNVVVRQGDGVTVVEAIDPATMVDLTGNPEMEALSAEVGAALQAALDRLAPTA